MSRDGGLSRESLVWKPGMAEWSKAGDVNELHVAFLSVPPIPEN